MSWSYDTSLSTNKDLVRFKVGDTDENFPQVSDEEITALLVNYSVISSSIRIIKSMLAKYSFRANETVGRISVQFNNIVDNLKKTLQELEQEAISESGGIYCGGISKSDKESNWDNTDNVKPNFTRTDPLEYDEDDCEGR